MRRLRLLWLGALMIALVPPVARADDIAAIVRDYDAYARVQDPVRAGQRGDRAALRRWPDDSTAAVADRKSQLLRFRERLAALPANLPEEGALNRDLLVDRVDVALEGLAFDEERIPFVSGDGFYTTADYAALATVLKNDDDADAWLARLAALPGYYATETANMERGIRTGFTQPRLTVERAIADLRTQVEQPESKSPLLAPFATLPAQFPADRRTALRARAQQIVETQIRPAQRSMLEFFEKSYLPAARPEIGASSLPNGRDYYAYLVSKHTPTKMTPDEVHALGLAEVERIHRDERARRDRFRRHVAQFLAMLRSDPRFTWTRRVTARRRARSRNVPTKRCRGSWADCRGSPTACTRCPPVSKAARTVTCPAARSRASPAWSSTSRGWPRRCRPLDWRPGCCTRAYPDTTCRSR